MKRAFAIRLSTSDLNVKSELKVIIFEKVETMNIGNGGNDEPFRKRMASVI